MWLLAVAIHVPGSALVVLGENLLKRGSMLATSTGTAVWMNKVWLQGFVVFVLGNTSHFVAFMFAAQSMLEGLGACMFIFNLWFAVKVNRETLQRRHIWATLVLVVGISLAVAFGSHSDTKHTFEQIEKLLVRPIFLIYTVIMLSLAACLQLVSCWAARHESREVILAYTYSSSSAIAGSFSVVLSKSMAEALRNAAETGHVNPASPILVGSWLLVVLFWLYRLNQCLHRFPALFVVPLLHAVWLVCTVCSGGIFFREFEELPGWRLGVFCLGIVGLLLGVALMPSVDDRSGARDVEDPSLWLPVELDSDHDDMMGHPMQTLDVLMAEATCCVDKSPGLTPRTPSTQIVPDMD